MNLRVPPEIRSTLNGNAYAEDSFLIWGRGTAAREPYGAAPRQGRAPRKQYFQKLMGNLVGLDAERLLKRGRRRRCW